MYSFNETYLFLLDFSGISFFHEHLKEKTPLTMKRLAVFLQQLLGHLTFVGTGSKMLTAQRTYKYKENM